MDQTRRFSMIPYEENFEGAWPEERRASLRKSTVGQPQTVPENDHNIEQCYTHVSENSGHLREELPKGSVTFQQVLEEIAEDMHDMCVSNAPKPTPIQSQQTPRRKSLATPRVGISASQQRMRNNRHPASGVTGYFRRPRINSDGVILRRVPKV